MTMEPCWAKTGIAASEKQPLTWEEAFREAIRDLQTRYQEQQKRIVNLEQQVANQALAMKQTHTVHTPIGAVEVKSQAAAAQATEHLYAPLRSDTKPLLEMSAFVRKVSILYTEVAPDVAWRNLRDLVQEAQEILKRST